MDPSGYSQHAGTVCLSKALLLRVMRYWLLGFTAKCQHLSPTTPSTVTSSHRFITHRSRSAIATHQHTELRTGYGSCNPELWCIRVRVGPFGVFQAPNIDKDLETCCQHFRNLVCRLCDRSVKHLSVFDSTVKILCKMNVCRDFVCATFLYFLLLTVHPRWNHADNSRRGTVTRVFQCLWKTKKIVVI